MEAPLLAGEQTVDSKTVRLGFVAGVIQQEKLIAFERLLFRATRGNMFLKSTAVGSVLDPTSGEKQEKAVFVVFFAGERARTKILKVCGTVQLVAVDCGFCCRLGGPGVTVAMSACTALYLLPACYFDLVCLKLLG